jgi:hypothetical protein
MHFIYSATTTDVATCCVLDTSDNLADAAKTINLGQSQRRERISWFLRW